jgi:myo-inositol 2-dehydrogenase/D-chiro-inositol 1-dehydrogenase
MYQQEHDELIASIHSGQPINDGEWMSLSTMLAIMGRMAAYTGRTISYQEALGSSERLGPETYGWGDLPAGPVPIPGKTRFV